MGRSVTDFNFKELLIYYETPKDLVRVSPTILISLLPFANYVIFPIAYRFPRYLLSQHYWTLEQRVTFTLDQHEKNAQNYASVLKHLQSRQSLIPEADRENCKRMFEQLESGMHPSAEKILAVRSCFSLPHCYGLRQLSSRHQVRYFSKCMLTSSFLLHIIPKRKNFFVPSILQPN